MMNITCSLCNKNVSSPVPDDTVFRAMAVCPECIEKDKVVFTSDRATATCSRNCKCILHR